ncbi:inorganic phosphate transporter [Haladaptatus halobius]|uniref:inorganic phosphate transporter n=1 Tax=Haladaptatus halobius TaxID=2884875 RepID=UPI001D0BC85D|nr:inorganic phosphate transporter [Haladaptatus halobius]
MAWTVRMGAPYAPSVGARTMITRAAFVTGVFGIAGAMLQGANVTEAMAAGEDRTSTAKIIYTVLEWVVPLLLSFVLAFGLLTAVELL